MEQKVIEERRVSLVTREQREKKVYQDLKVTALQVGLVYKDQKVNKGREVRKGKRVIVSGHY